MADFKQNPDGSVSIYSDQEGLDLFRSGGAKTPTATTPNYRNGAVLKFSANGGTDTGGGLTSWQNTLGYDIIVTFAVLDVTVKSSGACTVSVGQTATNATTLSSNFINGQDVGAATGTFCSAMVSIKVLQGKWITASVASGGSAALIANVYASYVPA